MHENREVSGASRLYKNRDRPAKAESHKAGAHAPEKSDRAVVPMNQPNKGRSNPGGGWGGKGAGQGEHCSVLHEPDTEREKACLRD